MRLVSFILLVFLCDAAFAQSKRISHWYFGFGAGLDFNSGTAINDRSGIMESLEGSAVMSDEQGNLKGKLHEAVCLEAEGRHAGCYEWSRAFRPGFHRPRS